jgi:GTP-binding protein
VRKPNIVPKAAIKVRGKSATKPLQSQPKSGAAAVKKVAAKPTAIQKRDAKAVHKAKTEARKDAQKTARPEAVPQSEVIVPNDLPALTPSVQTRLERILAQANFTISAGQLGQLPVEGLPEVAFCGRSNAGKSSAMNTICNRKKLAFVSKTPGRTQLINMFGLGYVDPADAPKRAPSKRGRDELVEAEPGPIEVATDIGQLVDLPGYGFASAPMAVKKNWESLIGQYLVKRHSLTGLFLVMDIRHPLTKLDWELLAWVRPDVTPVHALLTKSDKISKEAARKTLREVKQELARAGYQVTASMFSSLKREGMPQALAAVHHFLKLEDRLDGV